MGCWSPKSLVNRRAGCCIWGAISTRKRALGRFGLTPFYLLKASGRGKLSGEMALSKRPKRARRMGLPAAVGRSVYARPLLHPPAPFRPAVCRRHDRPWTTLGRARKLYLIFFNWPKGAFVLRGLRNRVAEARVLGRKGARLQVEHGRDSGTGVDVLTLRGLPPKLESHLGVVRLKIRGRAAVADQSCLQQPDGVILLPTILAQILNSPSARSMGISRRGVTAGWTNKANRMSWRFKLLSVGTYDVFVQWSKRKGATRPPRHRVAVEIAGRRLACDLCEDAVVATPRTGHLPESLARAGTVTFDSPGTYTTKLRALRLDRADKAGLVLVGLRLEPAG